MCPRVGLGFPISRAACTVKLTPLAPASYMDIAIEENPDVFD